MKKVLSGIFYPKRWQISNSHFRYNKSFIAVINKRILIEIVLSKRKLMLAQSKIFDKSKSLLFCVVNRR